MQAGYDSGMPMNPCDNCPYLMGGQYFPQQYMQTPGMEMYEQGTKRDEDEADVADDIYRQQFHGPRPPFFPPFFHRPRPFFFPPFFFPPFFHRPRPFFFPPFFPPFFHSKF